MPDSDSKEFPQKPEPSKRPKRDINAELRQIRDQAIKESVEMNKVVNQEPVVVKNVAEEQLKESATELAEKESALVSQIFSYADSLAAGGERIDFHYFEADRDADKIKIVAQIDNKDLKNPIVEFSKGGYPTGRSFGVNTDVSLSWWVPPQEIKNYVYVDEDGKSAKRPNVVDSEPIKPPHPMMPVDFSRAKEVLKDLEEKLQAA